LINFLVLYRGRTLSDAEVIAITDERPLVSDFAQRMLRQATDETDPILRQAEEGKRRVLQLVKSEISS
jgi:hypothetical protein